MFLMWFVTGIGMIYSRGMPRLTPQVRLSRLSPISLSKVKLSPADAAAKAGIEGGFHGRVTLQSALDRPIYRLGNLGAMFADTGEWMQSIDAETAVKVAAGFMSVPESQARLAAEITEPDQWTLTLARQLPLYKIAVDDASRTELYVSPETAEVVQVTTRGSRMLSWVSTIPHFLYFAPLRMANGVWNKAMVWVPAAACVLAALGIVLGIVQIRRAKPHILYKGWMRWHHITGLVFGILTLTFAFSGLLSMEPWAWTEHDALNKGIAEAFQSRALNLADFGGLNTIPFKQLSDRLGALKEIEFVNVLDRPYYIARTSPNEQSVVGWPDGGHQPYFIQRDPDSSRVLIDAASLEPQPEPIATENLVARLEKANPNTAVVESAVLTEYDSYYYSRDGQAHLPVVRMKLDDHDNTWVYVDPAVVRVVGQANRYNRIERWLYNALHTLDFSFLYYNRPAWDAVVIFVSLGGAVVSGIGLFLGMKRLRRSFSFSSGRNA
jgi:uncharacterized membrane protein